MYVYVLHNRSLPDIVKVGCSEDPLRRCAELNTTGVPGHWEVFARFFVVNKYTAESAAHVALLKYHAGKEFFQIQPAVAAENVAVAIAPWHVEHAYVDDDWAKWFSRNPWEWWIKQQEGDTGL